LVVVAAVAAFELVVPVADVVGFWTAVTVAGMINVVEESVMVGLRGARL
jgi:hypothetical protein